MGDDFESVALVDEKLLSLGTIEHFLGVFRHQRVEEGIEAFVVSPLCPKDSTFWTNLEIQSEQKRKVT